MQGFGTQLNSRFQPNTAMSGLFFENAAWLKAASCNVLYRSGNFYLKSKQFGFNDCFY
jgi:hypothetical protein